LQGFGDWVGRVDAGHAADAIGVVGQNRLRLLWSGDNAADEGR
jgi:hypothetical protein